MPAQVPVSFLIIKDGLNIPVTLVLKEELARKVVDQRVVYSDLKDKLCVWIKQAANIRGLALDYDADIIAGQADIDAYREIKHPVTTNTVKVLVTKDGLNISLRVTLRWECAQAIADGTPLRAAQWLSVVIKTRKVLLDKHGIDIPKLSETDVLYYPADIAAYKADHHLP